MLALLALPALAGDLDVQVSLDALVATSKNGDPGAGQPESLASGDLGMRAKLDLTELDGRFRAHVDYRGRQPVFGQFRNSALPLLYRAEARYAPVKDVLWIGAGRFIAPTSVFLPIDGLNVTYTRKGWRAGLFAGRRAISTGRANIGFGDLLPAVGGFFGVQQNRWGVDATVAWSQDLLKVGAATEGIEEKAGGLTGVVRANARPVDILSFGGQVALQQQATYYLGPTWTEATVEVQALDLFNALGWASIKPTDWLRVDVDGIHQNVAVYAAGTIEGEDQVEDLQEPRFTDARLRVRIGPPQIGWLRPMLRYRVRPDRTELRVGARLDVNDFGVPGPYATVQGAMDDIRGESQKQDVGSRDRTFGSAAVGFRGTGSVLPGLDAQLGASYVERAASPVSGRRVDPANPGLPSTSDDLQPFTLEADPIVFARAFYSGKRWFGGLDFEKHLSEPEVRALVQFGVLTEVGW
ncbi:MAG: hypothetical protein H6737_18555 [Alphaproteobacteria bacterium]|nr:hypothetical protein [Alphaproteobacteria bacterium]